MPSVRFMFTSGFDQDTVVIRIDEQEVARHGPITTRHDIEPPLAWSVDVAAPRDMVSVEVSVPAKQAKGTLQLSVRRFPQVDVSLEGKAVRLRGSQLVPSIG